MDGYPKERSDRICRKEHRASTHILSKSRVIIL
jgi:hypothetical protein